MKKQLALNIISILGALAFSYLFASHQLGLNALIFSVAIACLLLWQEPDRLKSRSFILVFFAHLYTAIMLVWQHSILAQSLYLLTFLTLVGYAQQRSLRFLWYGLMLGVGALMSVPMSLLSVWTGIDWTKWRYLMRWIKLSVLPIGLAFIFFTIYYNASADFAGIFSGISAWWQSLSIKWSITGVTRFLLGFCILGTLLWPSVVQPIIRDREAQWQVHLQRKRRNIIGYIHPLALQHHYFSALISLALLNVLLLLVNLTDLRYIWLDFGEKSPGELSDYVHAGTNLLILAIVLAIGLILYFFRNNLNFFPDKGRRLQKLAYLWVFQNGILATSVAFRNYHYLSEYGLTYLRIGVMVFLMMVIAGLVWVYHKVKYRQTTYQLLINNAWSILGVLLVTASFNWDILITRYNIFHARSEQIDAYYLCIELSDKNLYLLERYQDLLAQKSKEPYAGYVDDCIQRKRWSWSQKEQKRDWRIWNRADHFNRKQLSKTRD